MIDEYTKVGRFFPKKPVIMDNLEKYPNEIKNVYELSKSKLYTKCTRELGWKCRRVGDR